jgi:hypothetical protein
MYMKTATRSLVAAALIAASFAACNKKDNNNGGTTTDVKENVQYVTYSDQIGTDMEMAFDEALQNANNGVMVPMNGVVLGPCVTITLTLNGNLKTLTIDYGTQGCLCNDGKTRKGKLVATAANFNVLNVLRTLTTENYYVNDYHVEGTITRNITRDISEHTREAQVVENLTITNPGNTAVYTRSATLTRIFDYNTLGNPIDNTLTTWGQVNVTRPNGNQITRIVSQATPLFFKNSCHQVVSGIANITTNGNNYTIDFGNGACDDVATASNGINTWTINL